MRGGRAPRPDGGRRGRLCGVHAARPPAGADAQLRSTGSPVGLPRRGTHGGGVRIAAWRATTRAVHDTQPDQPTWPSRTPGGRCRCLGTPATPRAGSPPYWCRRRRYGASPGSLHPWRRNSGGFAAGLTNALRDDHRSGSGCRRSGSGSGSPNAGDVSVGGVVTALTL